MIGKRLVALFGQNIGAGRDQAAQMRHSPDFGPMVEATLDSWAHYPMVVALVAKCRTGHCTQWSFGSSLENGWARPGHEMGTGWAQSKKPPCWAAFALQLTR